MATKKYELAPEQLRVEVDPKMFDFECTKDLAPLREFIGQDRAIRGIEFGLAMKNKDYNIYVAGLSGTGKTSMVKTYVSRMVAKRKTDGTYHPDDWVYLYNFAEPDKPRILNLPQGKGKVFKDQMAKLLEQLKTDLTRAFASEDYKNQVKATIQAAQTEQQKLLSDMGEEARQAGFLLQMTPAGPLIVPLHEGKAMPEEVFSGLEETARKEIETKRSALMIRLGEVFEKARETERKTVEKLRALDKGVAEFTVASLFEALSKEYKDFPEILRYLNDLKSHAISNLDVFKERPEPQQQTAANAGANAALAVPAMMARGNDPFLPFQVNVFVDNSECHGPPVITESNPTYLNLFGKIERRFLFGGYLSDHTMIRAGAMQKANGGYLLLSAKDVVANPAVWPTLKRAIKDREVRIEEPFEQFGLFVPQGLRPEPMPVDVKVILIGDSMLYQMLAAFDEDFFEIFRVKSDFDYEIARNKKNMFGYAAFIAGCCEDCQLRHFDPSGVGRVIDHASRMISDQEKLSTRFSHIKEIVEEAEYWARQEDSKYVSARHVDRAIDERRYRHNLPDEHVREMITRGMIMIDTEGEVVGQVNGLSVYALGDITFGKPSRITCRTYLGRGGVINIERESQMSGRIHDKGVLILSGYMGWKYAQDFPLSLSASIAFEQSYEGVEGDSASSTELYALLSSLADVPIKQYIAVTGSVNQKGEIQPIGGINQKIEGYFELCRARGLSGEQGVLMPAKNLKNLMLRDEVVDAVGKGQFHIWAVENIEEGIEVLTGVKAGQKKTDGTYPHGSVNHRVVKQLRDMAERLRTFTISSRDGEQAVPFHFPSAPIRAEDERENSKVKSIRQKAKVVSP